MREEQDRGSPRKILLHSATPENLYDLIFEGLHVSKSGISFVENMADIASRDAPGNQGTFDGLEYIRMD